MYTTIYLGAFYYLYKIKNNRFVLFIVYLYFTNILITEHSLNLKLNTNIFFYFLF